MPVAEPFDIMIEDEGWSEGVDGPLQVRLYRRPETSRPRPAIIDVHGGAWSSLDRTAGAHYDRALAAAGFLVAAIDFHQGPGHQHPSASRDVSGAVRWLRLNAERLDIDPGHIGLIGSSSGGHLAMLAGIMPNGTMHRGARLKIGKHVVVADESVPAAVEYVIALWPVSDPFFRYRYAKRTGMDRLVSAQDGYFGSEDIMRAASVIRVVTSGEAEELVPLMVVQPGEDANVPMEMTSDLLTAWQNRGGYVEYAFFPGQPHGFGHRDSTSTGKMIDLIIDFARRITR